MNILDKEELSKIKNDLDIFIDNLLNLKIEVVSKDKANVILSNLKSFIGILRLDNILSDEDKFNYKSQLTEFINNLQNTQINILSESDVKKYSTQLNKFITEINNSPVEIEISKEIEIKLKEFIRCLESPTEYISSELNESYDGSLKLFLNQLENTNIEIVSNADKSSYKASISKFLSDLKDTTHEIKNKIELRNNLNQFIRNFTNTDMSVIDAETIKKYTSDLEVFIKNLENPSINIFDKSEKNMYLIKIENYLKDLTSNKDYMTDGDKYFYYDRLKDFLSNLKTEIDYGAEKTNIDEKNMRGMFYNIKAFVSSDKGEYVTGYSEMYPDLVKASLDKYLKDINEGNRRYRFETNQNVIKEFIKTLTPQKLSPDNIIKESFKSMTYNESGNKRFYANDTFLASLDMSDDSRRFYSKSELEDKINTFNDYKKQVELIYGITNRLTGYKIDKFDKIMNEITKVLDVVFDPLGYIGGKLNEYIGVNYTSYMAYKMFMIYGMSVPNIPSNIDGITGAIPFFPYTITDMVNKLGFDLFKVGRNNVAYYTPEPYYNKMELLDKKKTFRRWYNKNLGSTSETEVYSYNTTWQMLQKYSYLTDDYVKDLKNKVSQLQKFLSEINGKTQILSEESKNLIDDELKSFLEFLKMEENSRKYEPRYKGDQRFDSFIKSLNKRFFDKDGKLLKGYTQQGKESTEVTLNKIVDKFAVNLGRIHTPYRMTKVFLQRYNRFKKIPEVSVGGPRHTHVFFIRPNLSIFTNSNSCKKILIDHPDPQIIYMAKRFPNFIGYLDKDYGVNSDTPLNIPFTNYCKRLSVNDVTIDLNNHNANNLGSFQKTLGPKEKNMYNITFSASFHKDNVDSILHMVEYWEYYTRQARLGVITPRKETLMKNYVDSFSSIFIFETAINDIDIISWAKISNVLPTSIPYSEKSYDIKNLMQYETNVSFYAEKFTFNQVYHLIEFNKIMTGIPNIGDIEKSTLPNVDKFVKDRNTNTNYSHILERGDDFWYPKKAVVRMVDNGDGIGYILGFLGEENKK